MSAESKALRLLWDYDDAMGCLNEEYRLRMRHAKEPDLSGNINAEEIFEVNCWYIEEEGKTKNNLIECLKEAFND